MRGNRTTFVAVLSDVGDSSWIFIARFDEQSRTISIKRHPAPTFVDAIIYADVVSREQYRSSPRVNDRFDQNYDIIAVGKRQLLFSVRLPAGRVTRSTPRDNEDPSENAVLSQEDRAWHDPARHTTSGRFVLKASFDGSQMEEEIRILRQIRDENCPHIPELVWAPVGDRELGIVPLGKGIPRQPKAEECRAIIHGLLDGLRHLHSCGIVHRDIRPSNLILVNQDLVIVDYETAIDLSRDSSERSYKGGFICWPHKLLIDDKTFYTPNVVDDLYAAILVTLHMLFPARFDNFRANNVSVYRTPQGEHTAETRRLIALWGELRVSSIWKPFVEAAEKEDYKVLKEMAAIFCHI